MNKELIRAEFRKVGFEVGFCKDGNMVGRMIKKDERRERGDSGDSASSRGYGCGGFNNCRKALGNLRSEFIFGLGRIWR